MNDKAIMWFLLGGLAGVLYSRYELNNSLLGKVNNKTGGILF